MRPLLVTAASAVIATMAAGVANADTIRFWTTENQPERLAKQQAMADDFAKASGHTVEVIPVEEKDLGTRATAAFAAGDLPDVIYHTLQYVLPWAEAGILDVEANSDIVDSLQKNTFAPGAITMAQFDGMTAAVPVDGWTQMVVYRKDLFQEAGLAAPTSYAAIEAAVDALHNPPSMYGFVAPNKVDENFMSQVLEHVFLANGVSPVGADGFAALDEAATTEVTDIGPGRATCIRRTAKGCDDACLRRQFGRGRVVIDGRRSGVTKTGQLVKDEGRPDDHGCLAGEIHFARLLPVELTRRRSLGDLLVEIQNLGGGCLVKRGKAVGGLETADRWGVTEGQLSLASKMINSQVINRIVRQYIDDEIGASEAVAKLNAELAAVE